MEKKSSSKVMQKPKKCQEKKAAVEVKLPEHLREELINRCYSSFSKKTRDSEKGATALIIVTIITIIAVAIGLGLAIATMSRSTSATNMEDYNDLQKLCDAGLTKGRRVLYKNWASINTYLSDCYNSGTTNINTIKQLFQTEYGSGSIKTLDTTDSCAFHDNLYFHDAGLYIYVANGPQDTNPVVNTDNKITIYITATNARGEQKQIKAVCEYIPPPSNSYTAQAALLAGDSVTLSGNASVTGTDGVVEANGNLTLNGGANISVAGYATGNVSGAANLYGNQPTFSIPTINAYTSASLISGNGSYSGIGYWITSNGNVYQPAVGGSPMTSPAVNASGWTLLGNSSDSAKWWSGSVDHSGNISFSANNTVPNGAFFFETASGGSVSFSGNASGNQVTIFTNGTLTLSGNSTAVTPYLTNVMVVANGNLTLTGNGNLGNSTQSGTSIFATAGSLTVSGNGTLYGSVTAQGTTSIDTLSGNAKIVYNGTVTTNLITVVTHPAQTLLIRMYQEID